MQIYLSYFCFIKNPVTYWPQIFKDKIQQCNASFKFNNILLDITTHFWDSTVALRLGLLFNTRVDLFKVKL